MSTLSSATDLQLLAALALDCERRANILGREISFFLGALDHRVPENSNSLHFDSQKGPISHLKWTARKLEEEVKLVIQGATFVLDCVNDALRTQGSTRVKIDKIELHLLLVLNALGAHISSLARQMGTLHGRYEQVAKYSIPDHPSTAIYGLRDSTLMDRYLAEAARQIFRDLVRFVARDDTFGVHYPFETVPRVFVTRVYDPDARVQRFRTSRLHTDWVNWYQPGAIAPLEDTLGEPIRNLTEAPESFVSVEMPFWLPDCLELVPVIAHELAHVVVHDSIGSINSGNWGGAARDGLENLLRRIAQVIERTVFDAKEPSARAWALEIVCDLLAFARFRHAYLFTAATQTLTSGQIRGFDLDTFEESRIAPILAHLISESENGPAGQPVARLTLIENMAVSGACHSNQSADQRGTLLLLARLQRLAKLSGKLAGGNHRDANQLAREVDKAVNLLRTDLFKDQQVVGFDDLVQGLFDEVTVVVPEKGQTYWSALEAYWSMSSGDVSRSANENGANATDGADETELAERVGEAARVQPQAKSSSETEEAILLMVQRAIADSLRGLLGEPAVQGIAPGAGDGGVHGLSASMRAAQLPIVPGADYFLCRQRISSSLLPALNDAVKTQSTDMRYYQGDQVQDVVWRERWAEATGRPVQARLPRSLVLRPHIRRLVDDYLFRSLHPAPMFDLLSKRLGTADQPQPTFIEVYKTNSFREHSNSVGDAPHIAAVFLPASEMSDYIHTGRIPVCANDEIFPTWCRERILGTNAKTTVEQRQGHFPNSAWVLSFYLTPAGVVRKDFVLPDKSIEPSASAVVLLGRYDIVSLAPAAVAESFPVLGNATSEGLSPTLIHKRCVVPLPLAGDDPGAVDVRPNLDKALAITMVALASPLAWRVFAVWFSNHNSALAKFGLHASLLLSDGWEQVVVLYHSKTAKPLPTDAAGSESPVDGICHSLECISDHPLVGRTETMFTKNLFAAKMTTKYDISVRFRCRAQAGTALKATEVQGDLLKEQLPGGFDVRVRTVSGLTDYEVRLFDPHGKGGPTPSPDYLHAAGEVHKRINDHSKKISRLISQVAFSRRADVASPSPTTKPEEHGSPPNVSG